MRESPPSTSLVGVIDIGTNTTRFLATVASPPIGAVVLDQMRTTRLGEGIDASKRLAPAAVQRTLDAVRTFAVEFEREGGLRDRLRVVGTSALRDATNAADLLDPIRNLLGLEVEIVAGIREAELVARGVTIAMGGMLAGAFFIFDVGGGSTEIIAGRDGRVELMRSFDVGAVRLTERRGRPETPAEARRLTGEAALLLEPVRGDLAAAGFVGPATTYGVGGTVVTLGAVRLGLTEYRPERLERHAIPRADLSALRDRFASLSAEELAALPGMEPGRADIITSGTAVVCAVAECLGSAEVLVTTRGIRHGVLAEMIVAVSAPSSSS